MGQTVGHGDSPVSGGRGREEGGRREREGVGREEMREKVGRETEGEGGRIYSGLANLQVSVGVRVAVCKVASILRMLECIGPCEAIVVCLRLSVCPSEGRLEVGDVVTCTVPAEVV